MDNRLASRWASVVGLLILIGTLAAASSGHAAQVMFSSPGPPRERIPPPPVGTSTIKGRVVDGVSGTPVARARVRISGSGGIRPSVMTDASGAFSFPGLPGGLYNLYVEKASYHSTTYPDRGRGMRPTSKPLTLQDGQTLDTVTIALHRMGVIAGRVVDSNGEPVEGAQIQASRVGRPGSQPGNPSGTSSNDLGEFRLSRLDSGSYVVMASAQRSAQLPDEIGPDGRPLPQPMPVPTYYPNVVARDEAQAVNVRLGHTASGIDITLVDGQMGTIAGTVIDPAGQPVGPEARISINHASGGSGTSLRPDGTFRATVAPGEYVVEARLAPPVLAGADHQPGLFGRETVSIPSGGNATVLITLGKGASATGRIVFEGTSPLPENFAQNRFPGQFGDIIQRRVPWLSEGRSCIPGALEVAADWSFKIEGLHGTCTNQATASFGRWILKSVSYDGDELLDRPIAFKPGQQYRNVQVVYTDRPSEVTFRVSDESGQQTREYGAIVFPADKTRWSGNPNFYPGATIRAFVPPQPEVLLMQAAAAQTQSPATRPAAPAGAPARREVIGGLRPGEYLAIAVDNIESEEYSDPGVLEKLAPSATKITLADGATVEVPLRRVRLADLIR